MRKKFGSVPSGVVQGGAVSQVVVKGVVDTWLTSPKPDIHFFRHRLLRTPNFATDVITQQFVGGVAFGREFSLTVAKAADLLKRIFMVMVRPGIKAVIDESYRGGSRPSGSRPSGSRPPSRRRQTKAARRSGFYFQATPGYQPGVGYSAPQGRRRPRRAQAPPVNTYYHDDGDFDDYDDDQGSVWGADHWQEPFDDLFTMLQEEEDGEEDANEEIYAHWVNELGHAALARTTMLLANGMAQMLTGKYCHIWHELCCAPGKEADRDNGRYDTVAELIEASKYDDRLYVELPYSNTRFSVRALPLINMRYHACDISIALNPLQSLVKVSRPDVKVLKTVDDSPLTSEDVEVSLDLTYVFLDMADRVKFSTGVIHQLFDQVQYVSKSGKGDSIQTQLTLNNPVRALMFTVQRKSAIMANDTFDFGTGIPNEDPVEFAQLVLNTVPRFSREGEFFRRVMTRETCPRRLRDGRWIYLMPFCMDMTSDCSTSTFNFSRCDSAILTVDLAPSLHNQDVELEVYALSVNVAEFKKGLHKMLYR